MKIEFKPVSYTHLDVYKRQVHTVFGQVTDNLGAVRAMRNGDVMTKVEITEE